MKATSSISLAILSIASVDAVNILAYNGMGCLGGGFLACDNIGPDVCCRRMDTARGFSSCFFQEAQDTDFGAIFSPYVSSTPRLNTALLACGTSRETTVGPTCASHPTNQGARGCAWYECITTLGCALAGMLPGDTQLGETIPVANANQISGRSSQDQGGNQNANSQTPYIWDKYGEGSNNTCTNAVEPSKVVLADGHMFEVGDSTPAHHATALLDHFEVNSNANDLPPELRQYEINPEGVQHRLELLDRPQAHSSLTPNLGW